MPDVKTPFGHVSKPVLYGAIVIGGGIGIYMYVKKKNTKGTTANAATGAVANTYGYGSNGSYAYGAYAYGAYTDQPYGYGYYGNFGGESYGYGYYNAGVSNPPQATTNAQWSQAVLSAMTQQGYTGQQVLGSIGPYLQGKKPPDASIVEAAIAVEGYPPVDGPDGFPPAIRTGNGGGPGQGGDVTVPKVTGLDQAQGVSVLRSEGLKVSGEKKAIEGRTYIIKSQNPPAGASVKKDSTVRITSALQSERKK